MTDFDLLTKGLSREETLSTKGLGLPSASPSPPNSLEDTSPFSPTHGLVAASQSGDNPKLGDAPAGAADPNLVYSKEYEQLYTYAGSDLKVLLEVQGATKRPKHLIELVTLTVSIHREKAPVRALGYINAKGFARGKRTIAGTLVLTQFNVDFLFRFLGISNPADYSKDTTYRKIDQLPPFNLTLIFQDEYGHGSYRRLLGCDILTDGTVYSSNDMITEQSITYMASDFTPLLPLDKNGSIPTDTAKAEKTPKDVVRELTPVVTSRLLPYEPEA